jgi:hypothetical protein
MTRRIGNNVLIEPEAPAACEGCGAVAELRPYGPGGKRICFACGQKDKTGTERRMNNALFGQKSIS